MYCQRERTKFWPDQTAHCHGSASVCKPLYITNLREVALPPWLTVLPWPLCAARLSVSALNLRV
eukprot:12909579-Prorocentrum_lima.AAC.1